MNPFDPGYFGEEELGKMGFRSIGHNVRIAKTCTIIGLDGIEIGDNVRIDGYCTITATGGGRVHLGSYIHIGGYGFLSGSGGIRIGDFSTLSQGVRIYTGSDDYSGQHMTNPMVPVMYTGVTRGPVTLGRHVIVGSGAVVLPGVTLGDGVAVGALALVKSDLNPWGVFCGCPAKKIKDRSRQLLDLEAQFKQTLAGPESAP